MSKDITKEIRGTKVFISKIAPDEFVQDDLNDVYLDKHEDGYIYIRHPYLSSKLDVSYGDHKMLELARDFAKKHSLDKNHPTATIIAMGDKIVAEGANGSEYHDAHGCKRVELGIPSGQGYELCEGCHPKNHSEATAVNMYVEKHGSDADLSNAIAYLYGHWWLCQPCSNALESLGIQAVMLSKSWVYDFLGM